MESIFDGWERKIERSLDDGRGGFCARGWIRHYYGVPQDVNGTLHSRVAEVEERLAGWIVEHLPIPEAWAFTPGGAIAWANNELLLNIEGFRRVDLLTRGYMPDQPEEIPEKNKPDEIEEPQPELEPGILEPAAA